MSALMFLIPVLLIAIITSFIVMKYTGAEKSRHADRINETDLLKAKVLLLKSIAWQQKYNKKKVDINDFYNFDNIVNPTFEESQWVSENPFIYKVGEKIKSLTVVLPMRKRVKYAPNIANVYKCYNEKTDNIVFMHEYELNMIK